MKITDIKKQIKNADRYSIYIDNKYAYSLFVQEISDLGLKVGQEIKNDELAKVDFKAQLSTAKNSSLRLLSFRARSVWEIKSYLVRKKFSDEITEETINYLTSKGFLDDYDFARQWVENRLALKQASIIHIKHELKLKHIDDKIISEVIAEQEIDEVSLIKTIIEKKRQLSRFQDDLKLMQYLSRKGFSYDKIKTALSRSSER